MNWDYSLYYSGLVLLFPWATSTESPAVRLHKAPIFTYSGTAHSIHLPLNWKRCLSFSWLWTILPISIPCSLIFNIFRHLFSYLVFPREIILFPSLSPFPVLKFSSLEKYIYKPEAVQNNHVFTPFCACTKEAFTCIHLCEVCTLSVLNFWF